MLIIYLVIQFNLFQVLGENCATLSDENRFEITIGERLDLSMRDNFNGPNLRFSLVGANSRQFTVQQRMQKIDSKPSLENFVSLKQQGDFLAVLAGKFYEYKIYFGECDFTQAPLFENFIPLAPEKNCIDIEILNQTTFVALCQGNFSYQIQYASIDGKVKEFSFMIEENPQQLFINQLNHIIIVTRIGKHSYIDTIFDGILGEQLNKEKIEKIFDIKLEEFNIQQIVVIEDTLVILDKLKHLFYFKVKLDKNYPIFVLDNSITLFQQPLKITAFMDTWINIIVIALTSEQNITFIGVNKQIFLEKSLNVNNVQMQASDQYLVIYDKQNLTIYQFSQSQKVLMFSEELDIKQFIFNSKLNDFLIIDENKITRYVLSEGYLILTPPTEENTNILDFTVVASTTEMECEAQVSYIILKRMDSSLIKPFTYPDPFPKIICFPIFPSIYPINDVSISGPNQQVKVTNLNNDKVNLSIKVDYKQKISVIGLDQNYTRLITNIIEIDQITRCRVFFFRQYYQGQKLLSDFLICHKDKIHLQLTCGKSIQLQIKNQINQNQIHYRYENAIDQIYIYIADGKEVLIYKLLSNLQQTHLSISQNIDSIQFVNNFLVILTKTKVMVKQIQGYLEFFIDRDYLDGQGYLKEFNPTDISVSQTWNLIFIANMEDILIIQCFTQCNLVNQINMYGTSRLKLNVQNENVLIIMAEIEEEIVLYEYLIKDPHYITFQKQFEMYHFWLKFDMLYNKQDLMIYVFAYSPIYKSNVILAIRTLSQLRDALVTVFHINSENPICSVSGLNEKLLYLNDGQKDEIYLFTDNMQSTIEYNQQIDDQFIHNLEIESSFYNIDFPIEKKYRQTIQFVDLQTVIKKKITTTSIIVKENIVFPVDNLYFKGMITQYQILPYNLIQLQPSLQNTQNKIQFKSRILDQCNLNIVENITVILTQTSIEFYNKKFQTYSATIKLDDLNLELGKIECSKFISQLIVFRYFNSTDQYIQFFECAQREKYCYKYGNPYFAKDFEYITEMMVINTTLITLTTETKYNQSLISVFQIQKQDTNIILLSVDKIDKQRANQDFIINYMNVQSYQVNGVITYKLFLIEQQNGLLYIDATIEKYFLFKTNVINLNLQNLLQKNGLFEVENQMFKQIIFTSNPIDYHQEGYTEFYTLVITSNSLHYGIIVQYRGSKFSEIRLSYLLHTHQLWPMDSYANYQSNYVVMAYNFPESEERLVTIYNIPKQTQLRSQSFEFLKTPVLAHGAIRTKANFNNQLISFFIEDENQVFLFFFDESTIDLIQYNVYENTKLLISEDVPNQNIELFGSNFYYQNSIVIKIENHVSKSGLSVVVILLILLGALFCLALISYGFIRIRRHDKILQTRTLLE